MSMTEFSGSIEDDPRPTNLRVTMARHFHTNESAYRTGLWCDIVYEDADLVVIADRTPQANELSTWADDEAAPSRRELERVMRQAAAAVTDHRFDAGVPVVFDKYAVDPDSI